MPKLKALLRRGTARRARPLRFASPYREPRQLRGVRRSSAAFAADLSHRLNPSIPTELDRPFRKIQPNTTQTHETDLPLDFSPGL
jgi:hypothetical protein